MIYEIRTYTLKPGSQPDVTKKFGDGLPHREKYSKLGGFWYTDIGPLNQIIHLWEYESLEHRADVRAGFSSDPNWPPPIGEHLVHMMSEIVVPFASCPPLKPGKMGPIYELRSYLLAAGGGPKLNKLWDGKIEERSKMSPVMLVGTTEFGELNRLIHIWPYQSLEHRSATRGKAIEEGKWPPQGAHLIMDMQSKIMLPAPFSPMQ